MSETIRPLTVRQDQVLLFFVEYTNTHRRPPTIKEVCNNFGWKSQNSAICHLNALVRKGKLTKEKGIARGWALV